MVVTWGQQYHVGEELTAILYTYITRHAGTPSKTNTRDTMSLDTAHFCYIGSRIGWVSALLYYHIASHQANDYYILTMQEIRFCFLIIIRWIYLLDAKEEKYYYLCNVFYGADSSI